LWVHDVLVGDGIGPQELIERKVLPLLATPKYKGVKLDWRDPGDPSMTTPDQSSNSRSAAKTVEKLLDTRFEPGPTLWSHRIDPLTTALSGLASDGEPLIKISKSAYLVHRALNGGWHFKTDNNDNIVGTLPVKDQYSHPGDSLSYVVVAAFGRRTSRLKKPKKTDMRAAMARGLSYASGQRRQVA